MFCKPVVIACNAADCSNARATGVFCTLGQSILWKRYLTAPGARDSRSLFEESRDDAIDAGDLGISKALKAPAIEFSNTARRCNQKDPRR
jgi:hypothetical protein